MNSRCKSRCENYQAKCKYSQPSNCVQQCFYPSQTCPTTPSCRPCPSFTSPQYCSTPAKATYFYTEKTSKDDMRKKKPNQSKSRPSSAGSAKSTESKKSTGSYSKNASSDSKIIKAKKTNSKIKKRNKDEKKQAKIDPKNVENLRKDLHTIKEQLQFLTQNKTEFSLDASNNLQQCYETLALQNQKQQKEIEDLRQKNKILIEKLNDQSILEGQSLNDAISTKNCLDKYEATLNSLYTEFLNSTKAIEEKICCCGKEKSFNEGDSNFEKLENSYHKLKENERKCLKQNEELTQTIEDLETQLEKSLIQTENLRNEAKTNAVKHQQEMIDRSKCYAFQLELKSKEINELSSEIEELRNHVLCSCMKQSGDSDMLESKYEQLKNRYQEALQKQKLLEETNSSSN